MPGFALLPTLEEPTSHLTFRLSREDMEERNEWMRGAEARGMSIKEIAYEVGLSEPRVYQILRSSKEKEGRAVISRRKFKTPREAQIAEFYAEYMHPYCRKNTGQYGMCNDCFGQLGIIESEYDANGWPYSWAMYGQEKYIAACR